VSLLVAYDTAVHKPVLAGCAFHSSVLCKYTSLACWLSLNQALVSFEFARFSGNACAHQPAHISTMLGCNCLTCAGQSHTRLP